MNNRYLREDQEASRELAEEFGPGWLPPRPVIEIPAPRANVGDRVVVSNYRLKYDDADEGVVRAAFYGTQIEGVPPSWTYHVFLDKGYFIYIGDDAVLINKTRPNHDDRQAGDDRFIAFDVLPALHPDVGVEG